MKKLRRDIRVEALRILGILIVIAVHLCLPMSEGATLDKGRALISVFFADGVAIFWFISGFFMYDKYSYSYTMKRTFKTVVLPLVVFSIFVFFFGEFILNQGVSLLESVSHSKEEYIAVLRSIAMWENPLKGHVQLWYVYIYILLMLVSPVIYAFINFLNEDIDRKKWFMRISFALLTLNDISNNTFARFSHHTWNALVPAMILVVWGNLFYSYIKDKTIKCKHMGIAMLVFVFSNVLRWMIQIIRSQTGVDGIHIYFWFTSFAVINTCCLIVIVFYLFQKQADNELFCKRLSGIAANVFWVYLLHMFFYLFVQRYINLGEMYQKLCDMIPIGESFLSEAVYVLLVVPPVFIFTLFLAAVIRFIFKDRIRRKICRKKDAK